MMPESRRLARPPQLCVERCDATEESAFGG
jgi:hypothetical protein